MSIVIRFSQLLLVEVDVNVEEEAEANEKIVVRVVTRVVRNREKIVEEVSHIEDNNIVVLVLVMSYRIFSI